MQISTTYTLENGEWKKLVFSARHIDDRIPYDSAHNVLLDGRLSVGHRLDMFWVEISLGQTNFGAVAIEPSLTIAEYFNVEKNHCKINVAQWPILVGIVRQWFSEQREYKRQILNVKALQRFFEQFGGYEGFITQGEKTRLEWRNNAIRAIRENADLLASGKASREELDKIFSKFYYSTDSCYSGLDHILYLYETYVA